MGTKSLLIFGEGQGFAFGGVVAIPLGDFDYVIAGLGDDGLATKTGVQLLVGGHIEAVEFVVFGFAYAIFAVFDPDVAGGAGARPAARVVEEDAEILSDIEERHRLAVVVIRHRAEFELNGFAFGHEGDADKFFGGDVDDVCFSHWFFPLSEASGLAR